jgi:hypothetical protein
MAPPSKKRQPPEHGVGNMDPGVRPMKRVKSVGRNASRVYCPTCGSKRTKTGECPRGHRAEP